MRRVVLGMVAACAMGTSAWAQTADSVAVGAGYQNDVYWSFSSGVVKEVLTADWDLAFQARMGGGTAAGIYANGSSGVTVYEVPGMLPESFGSPIDTAGIGSWRVWSNSDKTWDLGALNRDASTEDFNFGWGEYSMVTHTIQATTVFLVQYEKKAGAALKYKQVMIERLSGGTFTVKIADLDGSNQQTVSVDRQQFNTRNFAYLTIADGAVRYDREPESASWDLLFGKYVASLAMGDGTTVPYTVTGVRQNAGISVARISGPDAPGAGVPAAEAFSTVISTIGYDWKSINMATFQWEIPDTLVYFVMKRDGGIERLKFTGFSGSASGIARFERGAVTSVEQADPRGGSFTLGIYPNVAERGTTLEVAYFTSDDSYPTESRVAVVDAAGRTVAEYFASAGRGLALPTSALSAGIYRVVVQVQGTTATAPFVVR